MIKQNLTGDLSHWMTLTWTDRQPREGQTVRSK